MQPLITAGGLALYYLRDQRPPAATSLKVDPPLTDQIGWPLFSINMHPLCDRPAPHPCDSPAYREAYWWALRLYPR